MNLMINDYCNLNCKYCFAGVNKHHNDITDENMFKYISFLKKAGYRDLRILGGEPTLHPSFQRYIETANYDKHFENILVFTNGYALKPELVDSIMSSKIGFLINLNKREDIGDHKYDTTIKNVEYLVKKYRDNHLQVKVTLGINIYDKDFDYEYIVEESKKLGLSSIRYSITVPKKSGEKITLDYYKQYIPQLKNFLRACYDNRIMTTLDCNNIPKCLFTNDELIEFQLCNHDLCYKNHCHAPLDVNLNLEVTRCFPFFEKFKANLLDFDSVEDVNSYFYNKIDYIKYEQPTFDECANCAMYKHKLCQAGCLTYKIREV